MFDLQRQQKKYKKPPYPKEAKPGNEFIQDFIQVYTTALHKTERRWNFKG